MRKAARFWGQAVLFAAEGSPVEVIIDTPEPSVTNSRGIASAVVTIPEIPPEPEEPVALSVAEEFAAPGDPATDGTGLEEAVAQQVALEPASVGQTQEPVQPVIIAARTAGVEPAIIQVNLIRETGLIKVRGDWQVVAPLTRFPEPFEVLATDETGTPVQPGTIVTFSSVNAFCQKSSVETDPNGFASVICNAARLKQGAGIAQQGQVTAQIQGFGELGLAAFAMFNFSVSAAANSIGIAKISGDGQTVPTGTQLPNPLVFRLTTGFGATGLAGIRVSQLSGPPVGITPAFLQTRPFFDQEVNVTLGPNAGNGAILVEAIAPKFPSATFNITATGGQPVDFEAIGAGQSARIGREIAMPLRMRIINESAGSVAFPSVVWSVVQGEATLITASDPDGALARVVMGNTPGPVVVRGVLGSLVATFN